MSRLTLTTTAALAVAALSLPAGAGAAPIDAAVKLEARAVADSAKALSMARDSTAKAKSVVRRSESALRRAYKISIAESQKSSADGLEAAAAFSASANAQGENLSTLVERSKGSTKAVAADALADTGRMEATLVARVAEGLEAQRQGASAQQCDDVASVGEDQAQLTATLALTASGEGLRDAVQKQLDRTTAASIEAQARLVEAVAALRERSEAQGEASMISAQASLKRSGEEMAAALRRSGRWDVTYEKTISTGDGPATVSATVAAHAGVESGGRR